MEELIKILQDVRDDVDFENTKDLIDGKVLTSFDIIQLITSLDDEYDISLPGKDHRSAYYSYFRYLTLKNQPYIWIWCANAATGATQSVLSPEPATPISRWVS